MLICSNCFYKVSDRFENVQTRIKHFVRMKYWTWTWKVFEKTLVMWRKSSEFRTCKFVFGCFLMCFKINDFNMRAVNICSSLFVFKIQSSYCILVSWMKINCNLEVVKTFISRFCSTKFHLTAFKIKLQQVFLPQFPFSQKLIY